MKNNIRKKIAGILAVTLTFGLFATGCSSSSSDGDDSSESNTTASLTDVTEDAAETSSEAVEAETVVIKAATGGDTKPYVYVDENNETTGYDIEVLKEIFNRLDGYELEIEITEIGSIFSGLNSGTYQIGVNNFSYNDERAESYLYSYPYDKIDYVFVTREGEEIDSFEDAAGLTFEAQSGISVTTAAESWNEENPDAQINISYTESSTVVQLQHIEDGANDFGIIDVAMWNAYQEEYDFNLVATPIPEEEAERIANNFYAYYLLPLDEEDLRDTIDEVFVEMKEDGTLSELSEEFFGSDTAPEDDQFVETVN